jgi:hypothetical protein
MLCVGPPPQTRQRVHRQRRYVAVTFRTDWATQAGQALCSAGRVSGSQRELRNTGSYSGQCRTGDTRTREGGAFGRRCWDTLQA